MSKLTPMMAQYHRIKEEYQDCILMFRMGDFYEMFFDDAVEGARILQIALTSRSKTKKLPMCGIPYHALEQYLAKLTRAGKKVALCDQMTEPTGKGIVEREVVRVVTPGTTFDEGILDQKANNYVAAVVAKEGRFAFAYADVTTGEFRVTEFDDLKSLRAELMRAQAAELIVGESLLQLFKNETGMVVFPYEYAGNAEMELKANFELQSLKIFGLEGRVEALQVAGMLMSYLKETQKSDLRHIQKVLYYDISDFMPLDRACVRNLELFFNNYDGKKEGSLINVLDETVTSMGGRMLRSWLRHPLIKRERIEGRLVKVDAFVGDSSLMRALREILKSIYDLERLISRLSLGTGNARDLVALRQSLGAVPEVKEVLGGAAEFEGVLESVFELKELVELLRLAVNDEPPLSVREGGMVRAGYNVELDDLRSISTEGKGFITDLQEREIKRTGISSLKVKFNKVFGYYIEISKSNLSAVPEDYIRKQTLVNAERYIVPELKEYEEKVLNAEDRIKELEYELFHKVRMVAVGEIVKLQRTARAIGELDVLANFAFIAERNNYCRPEMVEDNVFEVLKGRHAVVEALGFSKDFIANDCVLGEQRFLLITGPNMGGKSTYLRQMALIALMAQIGCFVPAERARIGLIDRIFTRVGASDNLAAGESTFMVEMQEAAFILNNATERSLVILDEVGRGTSTYDGLSIAWAMTEFLHNIIKAKTLFATHYHELVDLVNDLEAGANFSCAVRENQEEGVVFLYKIVKGGVDKSYGIEVAKLAGLPSEVVGRARGVLQKLEEKNVKKSFEGQMGLFERKHQKVESKVELKNELAEKLRKIDVENLTPIEALRRLDELKRDL